MASHALQACYEPYPHSAWEKSEKEEKGGRLRIVGVGPVKTEEGRVGGFSPASTSTNKRPVMPFRGLIETSNTKMIGEFQPPSLMASHPLPAPVILETPLPSPPLCSELVLP